MTYCSGTREPDTVCRNDFTEFGSELCRELDVQVQADNVVSNRRWIPGHTGCLKLLRDLLQRSMCMHGVPVARVWKSVFLFSSDARRYLVFFLFVVSDSWKWQMQVWVVWI